jgi:hypothetical protein
MAYANQNDCIGISVTELLELANRAPVLHSVDAHATEVVDIRTNGLDCAARLKTDYVDARFSMAQSWSTNLLLLIG